MEDDVWSNPVTGESEDNSSGPVGSMSPRTGVGESDDGTSRSSEGSEVYSTVTGSGGEVDAFDLGAEVDAEGSRVGRCIVLAKVSMLLCVALVITGFSEVAGKRPLPMVLWSMGWGETGTDILSSGH